MHSQTHSLITYSPHFWPKPAKCLFSDFNIYATTKPKNKKRYSEFNHPLNQCQKSI